MAAKSDTVENDIDNLTDFILNWESEIECEKKKNDGRKTTTGNSYNATARTRAGFNTHIGKKNAKF